MKSGLTDLEDAPVKPVVEQSNTPFHTGFGGVGGEGVLNSGVVFEERSFKFEV